MTDEAPRNISPATAGAANDNADIVQRFLFALADQDFDTFESLAAPELVWQNVGLPSIRGGRRISTMLRRGEGKFGFGVKFHRIGTDERSREEQTSTDERSREQQKGTGGTVLTERTDAIILGPVRLQFWVCGIFEVNDAGQVTLWRDYFDLLDVMVKAPLRALAGLVVPSLNPRL